MIGAGWTNSVFAAIGDVLSGRAGLDFPLNRQSFAEDGMRRAMNRAGIDKAAIYLDRLLAGEVSLEDLAEEVGVGETYFFRDLLQFETIRSGLLPDLVKRRGPVPAPKIWSAGCATGEEAYSLAILLDQESVAGGARIHATDISASALTHAKRGIFAPWALRGDKAGIAARYFRRRGDRFALDEHIRRRVTFSRLNLAGGEAYPEEGSGGLDIVLCRNVLIYFNPEAVQRVGQRLLRSLAPGGWLLTGPSDPLLQAAPPYETVLTRSGVVYRRSTASDGNVNPGANLSFDSRRPAAKAAAVAGMRSASAVADHVRHSPVEDLARAAVSRVRRLGDLGSLSEAECAAAEEIGRHPLSVELHFLQGVLLMEMGRYEPAAEAMRRALYLDPCLVVAQLSLGSILQRLGSRSEAMSAFQRGHAIAALQPPDAIMPLSDGASAERLLYAARNGMAALEARGGVQA